VEGCIHFQALTWLATLGISGMSLCLDLVGYRGLSSDDYFCYFGQHCIWIA